MLRVNQLDRCKEFASCPGSPSHVVKHGVVQDDGTIKLVVDRIENTDQVIDSFRESTDIYNIMARVDAGEYGLLNQKPGFYGDVVDMPKTYAEMLNLIEQGEQFFKKLPVEVKQKYNNDFNQFFADFDNAMAMLYPKEEKVEVNESEVKE